VNGSTCEPKINDFVEAFNALLRIFGSSEGAFPVGFGLSLEIRSENIRFNLKDNLEAGKS
jgi:hypothetical protein